MNVRLLRLHSCAFIIFAISLVEYWISGFLFRQHKFDQATEVLFFTSIATVFTLMTISNLMLISVFLKLSTKLDDEDVNESLQSVEVESFDEEGEFNLRVWAQFKLSDDRYAGSSNFFNSINSRQVQI
jgi:hypothetical protein